MSKKRDEKLDKEKILSDIKMENIKEKISSSNKKENKDKNKDKKDMKNMKNDDITKLKEEIDKFKEENKELNDNILRIRAESENFKKRLQQEFDKSKEYALQSLIEQLLPSLDSFNRALIHAKNNKSENIDSFIKGFEMIYSGLFNTLKGIGLTQIKTKGEKFNPYLHQAVSEGNNPDVENDFILEELLPGYKLNDRVIRASIVKVNKLGGNHNE